MLLVGHRSKGIGKLAIDGNDHDGDGENDSGDDAVDGDDYAGVGEDNGGWWWMRCVAIAVALMIAIND